MAEEVIASPAGTIHEGRWQEFVNSLALLCRVYIDYNFQYQELLPGKLSGIYSISLLQGSHIHQLCDGGSRSPSLELGF